MTLESIQGIDVSGKVIVLHDLEQQLNAGGVATPNGLSIAAPSAPPVMPPPLIPPPGSPPPPQPDGAILFTYDDQGNARDLPPEAAAIVQSYTA